MIRTSRIKNGFTLLELAVVLVLVSLMAGFAIKVAPSKDCYAVTRAQQRDIQDAIDTFVRANNYYPKPARRTVSVNNALYGVAVTVGTDVDRIGAAGPTAVLSGALPFATLGLNTSYAADCWGNKFTYMVSEELTDSTTYKSSTSSGDITVRTGTKASPATLTSMAAYSVISHGADALGASPRNYTASTKYCNTEQASGAVVRIDKENCDTNDKDIYSSEFNNGVGAPNFYDDLVVYANKTGYTGCDAGTVTWGACTANATAMAHGATPQTVNDVTAPTTGSASVACVNGTLTTTSISCVDASGSCSAQSVSWLTNCNGTAPLLSNGASSAVSNTNGGYSGSVTVLCSSGSLVQQAVPAPTCTSTASCSSTVSWGPGNACSATASAAHGASDTVANTASGYTGWATFPCTSGSFGTPTGTSCTAMASCTGTTASWGSCSGPYSTIAHGASTSVSNTAGGFVGSVTVGCNNGTPTQSGATCTVAPPSNCASQSVSWNGCTATASAMLHGNTASIANSNTITHSGTATATCSNGTITATGTCNAHCTAQSITWDTNCSATVSALNHGASTTATNTASNYTGSAATTCTNGTLSLTSTSCASVCGPTQCLWNDGGGTCCIDSGPPFTVYTGSSTCPRHRCNNGTLESLGDTNICPDAPEVLCGGGEL